MFWCRQFWLNIMLSISPFDRIPFNEWRLNESHKVKLIVSISHLNNSGSSQCLLYKYGGLTKFIYQTARYTSCMIEFVLLQWQRNAFEFQSGGLKLQAFKCYLMIWVHLANRNWLLHLIRIEINIFQEYSGLLKSLERNKISIERR